MPTAWAIAAAAKDLIFSVESAGWLDNYPGFAAETAAAIGAAQTAAANDDVDALLMAALAAVRNTAKPFPPAAYAIGGAALAIAAAAAPVSRFAAKAFADAPESRLKTAISATALAAAGHDAITDVAAQFLALAEWQASPTERETIDIPAFAAQFLGEARAAIDAAAIDAAAGTPLDQVFYAAESHVRPGYYAAKKILRVAGLRVGDYAKDKPMPAGFAPGSYPGPPPARRP